MYVCVYIYIYILKLVIDYSGAAQKLEEGDTFTAKETIETQKPQTRASIGLIVPLLFPTSRTRSMKMETRHPTLQPVWQVLPSGLWARACGSLGWRRPA